MADTEGPLSILPTIKCSSCGVDIDILQLADHVCPPAPLNNAGPPSTKLDRAATFAGSGFTKRTTAQARPSRMAPPPRIDLSAANKPFLQQNNLLTPRSNYSDNNSPSPLSSGHGRPPFKMNRSATSPMPRIMNPPSPDISLNMDCAFPPFPVASSTTSRGGRSNRNDKVDHGYKHRYGDPDGLYAPRSPRINGGESVMKRMDTIAPGPFDGRAGDRRPSTSHSQNVPSPNERNIAHKRTVTQTSVSSTGKTPNDRTSLSSNRSRSSTFSSRGNGLPSRVKPAGGVTDPPPPPPNPAEQTEGIDAFLDRLQKETKQPPKTMQDSRSRTFPMRQESGDATGPPPRPRRPSESGGPTRRPRDIGNGLPTRERSASRAGSRTALQSDNVPLMPPMPSYSRDVPPKPLHTPSDSGLSDDSVSSSGFRSAASSRSSPPGSEAGFSRRPSKVGQTDFITDEPARRVASPETFTDPMPLPPVEAHGVYTAYNPGMAAEPRLRSPSAPFTDAPESPLDPAIQRGLIYQQRPSESQQSSKVPQTDFARTPPRQPPSSAAQEPPRRHPTAATKGKCRGCNDHIVGKSIKDSSGRLTGRYHRECFVCRTCRSPFPSADFYVFDNFPYCEQHYHQLNGSLCKCCDRGIEGQYLETDQAQKFHPRCFTCTTCRIILRDDYYEVGGNVYCERHAYVQSRQNNFLGPGGNRNRNPQKRTTRLMMMM